MVHGVGRIGVNNPEGVETGAKKRLIGADVEGEDVVYPIKPGKHCVVGKKRHMKVGGHAWLPNPGKNRLKTIKGRKVSLIDRWILQKDYPGVRGRSSE